MDNFLRPYARQGKYYTQGPFVFNHKMDLPFPLVGTVSWFPIAAAHDCFHPEHLAFPGRTLILTTTTPIPDGSAPEVRVEVNTGKRSESEKFRTVRSGISWASQRDSLK